MLKGFGKNYFRLSSILAYSVAPKLQAQQVSYSIHAYRLISEEREEEEDDSPPLVETLFLKPSSKSCHCNKFFKHKTRLMLLFNHYIPRCPYYATHFAFRRTGVHPPFFAL